jgi:glycosyltransferase involved in cell wall biosynthesis
MDKNKYILITAARNEETLIEDTIKCVINQTLKPALWIIVSDNSTDKTDEIVLKYVDKYNFIRLIRNEATDDRNFASKVFALNLALTKVNIDYHYIGILDADITFDTNYYEMILNEFEKNEKLGLAGGEFFDVVGDRKFRVLKSSSSVRGGIQLFRKECFIKIHNFVPLKNGGEDVITEVLARKNGWETKSFNHLMLEHHRLTGSGSWNVWESKFKEGLLSYSMGYHPLFQFLKSIHRIKERPYLLSGMLHLLGFIYGNIKREKRHVSQDFIDYIRKEQLLKIKSFSM